PLGVTAGDGLAAVDHARGDLAAAAQNRFHAVIRDVKIEIAVAIDVREGQRMAAGSREETGGGRNVGESAAAEVEEGRVRAAQRDGQEVEPAIAIEVRKGDAFGGLIGAFDARGAGHVLEASMAEIAEQPVGSL